MSPASAAGLQWRSKRFARDRDAELGLVLVDGSRAETWYFAQFILSSEGQAILAKHGFSRGAYAVAAGKNETYRALDRPAAKTKTPALSSPGFFVC